MGSTTGCLGHQGESKIEKRLAQDDFWCSLEVVLARTTAGGHGPIQVQECEQQEPTLCPHLSVATHCYLSLQVTRDARTYSIGVCTTAAGLDQEGCKDGGVCLLSGNKGASFGRLASMQLDYRHQDEAVILSYVNGDPCPPGNSS